MIDLCCRSCSQDRRQIHPEFVEFKAIKVAMGINKHKRLRDFVGQEKTAAVYLKQPAA